MNEGPASSSFSNGVGRVARSSRPPPPIGVVVPARDPMLAILALDKRNDAAWIPGTVIMSALLQTAFSMAIWFHAQWGLDLWVRGVVDHVHARLNAEYEIELKEDPPPPPPEPPKEEKDPEPPPPPQAHPVQAPPPAAAPLAAAAHILSKQDDPNKVENMEDTIIDGNGNGGGGLTGTRGSDGFGTGKNPNPAPPSTGSALTPPPPPPPPPPPAVDKSRAASLSGATSWNCPWPPEADAAQIDEAYVTVTVSVRPDGAPASVSVTSDPGYGFGRYAQRCAMAKRYTPALDRDGNPMAGTTKPFRIHFSR